MTCREPVPGPWPTDCLERLGAFIRPPGSHRGLILYVLAGAPGAGKSTLCRQLAGFLASRDQPTLALSLDDYYLDPATRQSLARDRHPSLARRGLPGTHDPGRLAADLQALAHHRSVRLPRYDKGLDRPAPPTPIRRHSGRLTVILEGWCLGARYQTAGGMMDAQLASCVNDGLAGLRRVLAPWCAGSVLLRPPDWNVVRAWRHEQAMRRHRPAARQSRCAVNRFLRDFRPLVQDQVLGRWHCDLEMLQDTRRRVRTWRWR